MMTQFTFFFKKNIKKKIRSSQKIVSEPLPSLRWWERAQAQWGTPAGTLGPKRGWLWRSTSPGNEDVLICINAPFMTQRVLKPWWSWTYQNSAVKRAFARAILGWVTSWEVWFGEPKKRTILCHWGWVVTSYLNLETFGNFKHRTSNKINFPKDASVKHCAGGR